MSARSEGDETPLWLGARSGGINASGQKFRVSETSNAPAGRAGIAAHYVEGAGANVSAGHASTAQPQRVDRRPQ